MFIDKTSIKEYNKPTNLIKRILMELRISLTVFAGEKYLLNGHSKFHFKVFSTDNGSNPNRFISFLHRKIFFRQTFFKGGLGMYQRARDQP